MNTPANVPAVPKGMVGALWGLIITIVFFLIVFLAIKWLTEERVEIYDLNGQPAGVGIIKTRLKIAA